MSRCFPFPPPGYEKKARTDGVDFVTKEKHREKKQKKEKDKKREGKEKKDKEKSKDNHREKKDRKERRKDKKKDKDRDKTSDEKKTDGRPEAYNGEKPGENSQHVNEIKDSKFMEELGRRIRDEDRGTRNQMVENFPGSDHRRAETLGRVVEKVIDNRGGGKENIVGNKGDDRKTEGQRNRYEERGLGITMVQNFTGMDQRRPEGMARSMDKDGEKMLERKEKNKDKKSDDKRGDRHKDKNGEKKSKAKATNHDKKEKEEKGIHKNNKQVELRESVKKDPPPIETLGTKPLHITKDHNKGAVPEENVGKRKDFKTNGFLHDNLARPNKLPRPTFPSHPFTENGRKLEPCQTASVVHGGPNNLKPSNIKVDSKDHKVNGIIEAQPSFNTTRSLFTTGQAGENGEGTMKPPHPDSKYLSQILSVPKMGEWSDFDDQEWLFSNDDSLQLKKSRLVSSGVINETPQVWEKAIRIESADVSALPYVIPY